MQWGVRALCARVGRVGTHASLSAAPVSFYLFFTVFLSVATCSTYIEHIQWHMRSVGRAHCSYHRGRVHAMQERVRGCGVSRGCAVESAGTG
jgi:hypothetical protein